MIPIPEPAADVAAQVAAMLDPEHPKAAALVVRGNEVPFLPTPLGVYAVEQPIGTLLTRDAARADTFAERCDDRTMAWILGYPESKDDVVANCDRRPIALARAVQARDHDGNVITEAFASPGGLARTMYVLKEHVPPGGVLAVLTPVDAIGRRLVLRELEAANEARI